MNENMKWRNVRTGEFSTYLPSSRPGQVGSDWIPYEHPKPMTVNGRDVHEVSAELGAAVGLKFRRWMENSPSARAWVIGFLAALVGLVIFKKLILALIIGVIAAVAIIFLQKQNR